MQGKHVTAYLNKELHDKVILMKERENCSMNKVIQKIVRAYFENQSVDELK